MKRWVILGLIVSIVLVLFSPFASSFPDGLERVSEIFKFSEKGTNLINSPLPDYSFPLINNPILSTIIAGLIGTILVFLILFMIGKLIKKKDWLKILFLNLFLFYFSS